VPRLDETASSSLPQVPSVPLPKLEVEELELELELGLNSAVRYVWVSFSEATAVSMALYSVVSVAE
jgi:hypothetical protein